MRILLVSWATLPMSGGSSVIIENLARNFNADDLVVLGSSKLIQKNPQRPQGPRFEYFKSELYFMGRGYRYFIWFRRWRFAPLVRRIKKLIDKYEISHVIGVYPNPFYCLAACRAATSMQVPFSSYFHNTYIENIAIKDPLAIKYQTEIFNKSKYVFVMSEGMQNYYRQKYGSSKFVPLPHTYNEKLSHTYVNRMPVKSKKTVHLVAIGNFNESNLEATRRFMEAIQSNSKYRLHLYTHVPLFLLQKRGLDPKCFEYHGSVRPDEVHAKLQQYDICVLTHGFSGGYGEVEYQTIFPTRTIPFLLSGKPIFAHAPPDSFLSEFLMKHQCAQLVTNDSKEVLLHELNLLVGDAHLQKQLVAAAQEASKQFYGPSVASKLKKVLSAAGEIY